MHRAAERLPRSVRRLGDADVRAPSALPGWSRAHVLAHLARHADGPCTPRTSSCT
nr:maleylpyruvate isomerase N-terminal domain-containing protein [Amycolatopsis sp. CA-230715]